MPTCTHMCVRTRRHTCMNMRTHTHTELPGPVRVYWTIQLGNKCNRNKSCLKRVVLFFPHKSSGREKIGKKRNKQKTGQQKLLPVGRSSGDFFRGVTAPPGGGREETGEVKEWSGSMQLHLGSSSHFSVYRIGVLQMRLAFCHCCSHGLKMVSSYSLQC